MRKLNVTDGQTDRQTDGQTDRGRCNISRPGPPAPREIKRLVSDAFKKMYIFLLVINKKLYFFFFLYIKK